jgi:hypothetical protein
MFIDPSRIPASWQTPILWVSLSTLVPLLGYYGRKFLGILKNADHAFTNCLPTIQKNTEETNRLLVEMSGYFKAKAEDKKI